MKLSFLCCCIFLLAITPVLLYPTDGAEETVSAGNNSSESDGDVALDDGDDENEQPVAETEEQITTTPKSSEEKNKNHRRRPNKRPKNRYNQLHQNGGKREKTNKKHPPANGKKGIAKRPSKVPAIVYESSSPYTEQLNAAIDDMLVYLSQAMLNDSNASFNLRLAHIPSWLQPQPWAFVAWNTSEDNNHEKRPLEVPRLKREASEEDDEDDHHSLPSTTPEEADDDDDEDRHSSSASTQKSEPDKGAEETDHDDSDDDDEASDDASQTVSVPINKVNEKNFYLTEKPSPMLQPDGSVLYHFMLVNEEEARNSTKTDGQGKRSWRKQQRQRNRQEQQQYRYPRRPTARVEGLEAIQRSGDVLVGTKQNTSVRVFDVQVQVGPIKIVVKESADVPVSKPNVTSPVLYARLRLLEVDGKLVSARFKQRKINANASVVSIRTSEKQALPTESQIATTVTHLSQEMARSWNTGYIIRRVKKHFKQLYVTKQKAKSSTRAERIQSEEAKTLVHSLLVPFIAAPSNNTITS